MIERIRKAPLYACNLGTTVEAEYFTNLLTQSPHGRGRIAPWTRQR
jgi:hypothetical protein